MDIKSKQVQHAARAPPAKYKQCVTLKHIHLLKELSHKRKCMLGFQNQIIYCLDIDTHVAKTIKKRVIN